MTDEKLRQELQGIIGESIHAAARKSLDSKESVVLYNAINKMPDGEWPICARMAADQVIAFLKSKKVLVVTK